jgi:hypothetical protein
MEREGEREAQQLTLYSSRHRCPAHSQVAARQHSHQLCPLLKPSSVPRSQSSSSPSAQPSAFPSTQAVSVAELTAEQQPISTAIGSVLYPRKDGRAKRLDWIGLSEDVLGISASVHLRLCVSVHLSVSV